MKNEMKILMTETRAIPNVGLAEKDKECTLDAAFAQQLIDQGFAVLADGDTEKTEVIKPNIETVVEAIKQLSDGNNKEDFTDDGKPNANILSKICGFEVSASMRDKAFKVYQTQNLGE